jgi:hypothetical protein
MSTRTLLPNPSAAFKTRPLTHAANAVLQRKCGCSGTTNECEDCKKKKLQRRASGSVATPVAPPIVHDVVCSAGQALDRSTRAFFEPRFDHDFSKVRIHTDARAAESAQAVNALAYAVGRDVVFASGQYAPTTHEGRLLLAHELTHVVQQASVTAPSGPSRVDDDVFAEHEADTTASAILQGKSCESAVTWPMPRLSRKVKVDKPKDNIPNPGGAGLVQTNAKTIEKYLKTLCPTGSVAVDPPAGTAAINASFCTPVALPAGVAGPPGPAPAQTSKTATGCGCICDLVNSAHLWTIIVDDAQWPHTIPDDPDAGNGKKPGGTGGTVTAPSPNSPKLWGAATRGGKELDIDPWLVLGHELCGHGWLNDSGQHGPDETSKRGEGGHQATVARENALRAEHGIDPRGSFKDPDCGESYSRDKSASGTVNWSKYHSDCVNWRANYNAAHGTKYKITDKIP